MALIVQKFGGTSVGTVERIEQVAEKVRKFREGGDDIVVVVSAMSGETNRLIDLAKQISEQPVARELDVMVSTGEQVTIALLAMALIKRGVPAVSYTGNQVRILTDSAHTKARILQIDAQRIQRDIKAGRVVVVAGFQGVDEKGNITTLGRGGSDTTGVALAAALKADECQIYTDVDGVYTTDPRIVEKARKLDRISYEEMLELASLGTKVLQPRSVELAMVYKVPLQVRSSFEAPDSSNQNKPDGMCVILPEQGPEFVASLPVRRFHGVGPRTAEKMAKLGVHTGADLAQKDEIWLSQHFGSWGAYLFHAARGIDNRPVNANAVRKSIGAESTYFEDKRSEEELREALDDIVEIVWDRIDRNQAQGKTLVLKARYSDFRTVTRSRTVGHILSDRSAIAALGHALLDQILPVEMGVRLLGLTLSGLVYHSEIATATAMQGQFTFDHVEK